jgi:FG-GAP-like repeat
VGDIDADGRSDIAVAGQAPNQIEIFLNRETGFEPAGGFAIGPQNPNSGFPGGVVAGDFNQDGALDLAAVDFGSSEVSVILADP